MSVNNRNVAVPMQDLHVAMNNNDEVKKVTIDRSQNQLQSAHVFRLNPGSGNGS